MDQQNWKTWIEALSPDQKAGLLDTVISMVTPDEREKAVDVTRVSTESCYVPAPQYVDVMSLFPVYDRLAFNTNILIKGPKGVGKSLSYTAWAAHYKIPVISVECSEDVKKYDLMGSPFIVGEETIFVLGGVPAAIDVANEVGACILALEEINSLTPQVQKQLNAVSDFRQAVSLPFVGKTYRLREGAKIWVVASMNPTVYGGTYDLNEDLKSRFEEIEVTYPNPTQEKHVIKAVGAAVPEDLMNAFLLLAKETRAGGTSYPLSTRDLVRITHNVARVGLDTTLQMLIGKFENEDKDVILTRLSSIFGAGVKMPNKYWGS